MHQWWGDNVSESSFNLTFFKEGLATLGEYLYGARLAGPIGSGAFEQSLVDSFNAAYDGSDLLWTGAPSDPRPANLFSGSKTYTRPGISYIALRLILGPANFNAALQDVQQAHRQSSVTEAQLVAAFKAHLPSPTTSCQAQLGKFFTEWWDTVYPGGGGANRPDITAPGLEGGGWSC
jgi:aminopeptidase N